MSRLSAGSRQRCGSAGASLNWRKRFEADSAAGQTGRPGSLLAGKVAIVTGGRVKIGFQVT